MDNKIPIIVFGLENHQNIKTAILGKKVGTIIGEVC
jgi:uridylate kinase